MKFAESVAITFTSRIIIVFIAIASSIITARWLGPAGKGMFAVLWVIVGLGVQFGNFGLHTSNVYFTARYKEAVSQVTSNSVWFGLTIGLIICSGLVGSYLIKNSWFINISFFLLLVTIILIPFKLILYFLQHIFLGLGKIFTYNSIELAERTLLLATVFVVLVLFKQKLFTLMLCISVITAILTIFFIFYSKRITNFSLFKFNININFLNKMLGYGVKPYIANFFAFLMIRSDMLLVNYFKGASASGIYSIAANFSELLYLLPVTIGAMLFPKVSANIADDGTFTQKISRQTVFLMAIACILVALVCKPLILLMYGEQFASSVMPLLWLLPGIFFLSLATIYNNDLAGRGYPPVIILANGIGFALNFGLNILFIPRYGIIGAAITSSISYFVMFIIVLVSIARFTDSSIWRFLSPGYAEIRALFQRKK